MAPAWESPPLHGLIRQFVEGFSARHLQCEEARFLVTELPAIPENARRVVPFGLRLASPPRATLFAVRYVRPTFTFPYNEVALLIHVRTPLGGRAVYCPWIVVDDDTPMIYGRETLGYPKKFAEIQFQEDGDRVKVLCRRRGVDLIRIEARRLAPLPDPGPVFGQRTFNAGGLFEALAFQPIWMSRLRERVVEGRHAEMTVTLGGSSWDPLDRLVLPEPIAPRSVVEQIAGARYLLPAGLAGPRWFASTFFLRYR